MRIRPINNHKLSKNCVETKFIIHPYRRSTVSKKIYHQECKGDHSIPQRSTEKNQKWVYPEIIFYCQIG